ncbi:MAG: hypothetical protein ACRC2T_01605, partial [Thermoguttaceae bacterium]
MNLRMFRISSLLLTVLTVLVLFVVQATAQDRIKLMPKEFEMPFTAKTKAEAQQWQKEAREKVLGYVNAIYPKKSTEELPIDMKIESTEEIAPTTEGGKDGYTKHRITYMGNEGERKTAIF